jgi:methylthioxylose transferase
MEARGATLDDAGSAGSRASLLGLAAWVLLIGIAFAWGEILLSDHRTILLGAPPLSGRFNPGLQPEAIVTLAVAAFLVLAAPTLRWTLGWRTLLFASFAGAWVWAGAVDLLDGGYWLTVPVLKPDEFFADVPLVTSPGTFLSGFTDHVGLYVNHVQTHPPGMILTLWGLRQIGLGQAMPAALLMVTGGAAAIPAALVAAREVAGEERARAAAPYLVLAPAAIWVATSADALYAGIAGWGVALLVLATGREGRRSDLLALGGGLLLGITLMLSYGLVLVWMIPLVVAAARRRLRPVLIAVAGPVVVLGAFAAAGFWWLDGYSQARNAYYTGVAASRPYGFFLLSDLGAFAIALGPAVCAGVATLRNRALWLLPGAGLAAIAVADLSGMSKGEVERIWLPFAPFVMLAAAGLPTGRRASRGWLAAAALFTAFVEVIVRTAW